MNCPMDKRKPRVYTGWMRACTERRCILSVWIFMPELGSRKAIKFAGCAMRTNEFTASRDVHGTPCHCPRKEVGAIPTQRTTTIYPKAYGYMKKPCSIRMVLLLFLKYTDVYVPWKKFAAISGCVIFKA